LDANRPLWESLGIQDYRLTTERLCFCSFRDAVQVLVQGSVVTKAGDEFGFAIFSVDDLFDEVQRAIDQPAADLVVAYDAENGIPLSISVDQIAMAGDDEFTITSRGFRAVPGAAARADLETNRALWESLGIRDYSLTTLLSCFCIDVAPVTVVVRDGAVVSTDPGDAPSFNVLTVEDLFNKVSSAIDGPVDSLRVTYDPETGIPVDLAIDHDFGIAAAEEFIEVVDFSRLGATGRQQPLGSEWNLVGWFGGTPVATATASIAGAYDALFGWEPGTLNSLAELEQGQGYWVHVTAASGATWQQPVLMEPLVLSLV